jgi:5-methylcytosine-specific restriction endonuclease McrA
MSGDIQTSLMIDGWKPDEIAIFKSFRWLCILCGRKSEVIHEIIPKSQAPKTWKKSGNRVPLCVSCHDVVHRASARAYKEILEKTRDEKLKIYGSNH